MNMSMKFKEDKMRFKILGKTLSSSCDIIIYLYFINDKLIGMQK